MPRSLHLIRLLGGSVVLPLCHVVMRFLFLRQDTSVFLQRGGLCEAHRIRKRYPRPKPRTSGSLPIRRAACGVLDPLAFLCKNVSILPRARGARPPQAPGDPAFYLIRRAACGVLDLPSFLCKNVSILPRARHVPHRPPAILLFSLKKTSFSPRKVKGSGGNPQITSAPATRR